MKRTAEFPLVHPLYLDALSGEFRPFRDRPEETHTLGRLAVASHMKGSVSSRYTIRNGSVIEVQYRPSWAEEVTATSSAVIGRNEYERSTATIFGLHLEHDSGSELTVVEHEAANILHEERVLKVLGNGTWSSELPLTLENAATSRQLVTEAAQEFFDKINTPIPQALPTLEPHA